MNRFKGASIGKRMTAGFGLLLVLLGTLLFGVYNWHQDSVRAQHQFTDVSRPLSEAARDLERGILHVGIALRGYLLSPQDDRHARFEQHVVTVRRLMRELDRMSDSEGDAALAGRLFVRVEQYLTFVMGVAQNVRDGGAVDVGTEADAHALRESLVALTGQFIDQQAANAIKAMEAMDVAQARVTRGLAAIGGLSVLCVLVLGWLLAESIRRPARELVRIAGALQAGDWAPALALADQSSESSEARNEMEHIAQSFGYAAGALERREQRLAADRHVARAAAMSLERHEVANVALRAIVGYVRAEVGVVYWQESGRLEPIAHYGASAEALSIDDGLPGQAVRDRRAVVLRDIPRDAAFAIKLGYDEAPPRDVAAVPIVFRSRLLGVLLVASLHSLSDEALEFLDDAAAQLASGLDNVRAYADIQRLLADVAEKNQRIQAQNEALQAQNEEIQAQSEEVQAQNEELQAQGEEIRAQNEQLAEQSARLREHAALLAEADERKTEFLGLLAHELRNPMAGISNSLFVLQRPNLDPKQASTAQAIIDRQTKQLNRLIDDLLDVTRVTRGKVKLKREPLDFTALTRDCLADYRATLEHAGLELSIMLPEHPVPVRGDRARLCQIIGNLIDNAAKFTDQGRRVSIALRADEAASVAELVVADEGIGIDEAAFARLFQPFSQGDPKLNRTNGGLGLGLALVKSLVEMHEGVVEAYSDGPGKGARFTVRLPLLHDALPAEQDAAAPQSLEVEVPLCRILIIEDNPDVAQSLSVALSMEGHEVRVAYGAQEGLAIARSFHPDVLLCDIGLPVMDGYEVARRFRADDELRSVFLVAVTGYASDKDRTAAVQAGFDRHLPKPPDFRQLSELLAELAIRRARDSSAGAASPD